MDSGPQQETSEVRAQRYFKENVLLREKLRKCQWYLEAIGEAITLETAKEMATMGLTQSLSPAVKGEDDAPK